MQKIMILAIRKIANYFKRIVIDELKNMDQFYWQLA
jgi:hypothetical protein